MKCQCDTHIYSDKEKRKELLADLVTKKAQLAGLPEYIKNLEREVSAKDFNKTRYCVGHGTGCPCYEELDNDKSKEVG